MSFKESQSSRNHDQAANGICVFCERVGTHRCSRCKITWYCTKDCQATDWERHKPECKRKRTDEKMKDRKQQTMSNDDQNQDCAESDTVDKSFPRECGTDYTSVSNNDTAPAERDNQLPAESSSGTESQIDADIKTNLNDGLAMIDIKKKHTIIGEIEREPIANNSDCNIDKANDFKDSLPANCNRCNLMGCTQKCARCMSVFYCSKACQKEDWTTHKKSCPREYTEEEKGIIEDRQRKKKEDQLKNMRMLSRPGYVLLCNYTGGPDRYLQKLSPEKALRTATRPSGSLEKAVQLARDWFPGFEVLTKFADVPREPQFPSERLKTESDSIKYVLVAFMYRYHEHVMRHGVYLKDDIENESHIEIYLDHIGDNPAPFFTYSMVKPGNYICLVKPLVHAFKEGTVGFRIEDPSTVCIIEKDMLVENSHVLYSRVGHM